MKRLAREGFLGSFPKIELPTCDHCVVEKITKKSFGKVS